MAIPRDDGGGSSAPQVTTHETPPVYGGEALASVVDVPFPGVGDPVRSNDISGPAAKGLYDLAQYVEGTRNALTAARDTAIDSWEGPHKDTFLRKCSAFVTSANNVKAALETVADGIARAWAAAQGQQNRICQARHFAHEESEESGLNKFGDSLFGDEEVNEPDNPGKPSPASSWSAQPMHGEGCGH
jgi:hypothetical protein